MRFKIIEFVVILTILLSASCSKTIIIEEESGIGMVKTKEEANPLIVTGERHFGKIKQLTFGGQNAEAYFNSDDTELIFQTTRGEYECDQIFIMDVNGNNQRLVSTGEGRTTCGYFMPGRAKILYSSTHAEAAECPPEPDYSKGYTWAVYPYYDIYIANNDGSELTKLTDEYGYDAEATLSEDGSKIVFTSKRSGDLDIWTMNSDGSGLLQLTDEIGYDGGPFFNKDASKIVFRAYHPTDSTEKANYINLLETDLIRPGKLEIYVMDSDGSNKTQVTDNGAANFGPYFHPDGNRIIFSSNLADPKGRNFDLWMVNSDGSGLEQITYNSTFDGFPMFSKDGNKLVFASNRNNKVRGETNLFIVDWIE